VSLEMKCVNKKSCGLHYLCLHPKGN
jgi:hypothetical protein